MCVHSYTARTEFATCVKRVSFLSFHLMTVGDHLAHSACHWALTWPHNADVILDIMFQAKYGNTQINSIPPSFVSEDWEVCCC